MPTRNSKTECHAIENESSATSTRSVCEGKKRKICPSMEVIWKCSKQKRLKREHLSSSDSSDNGSGVGNSLPSCSFCDSKSNNKLVIEEFWNSLASASGSGGRKVLQNYPTSQKFVKDRESQEVKCWINFLPQEIMLKIFSYLPLGMLLHTIPQVCKKWEILSFDWTLWKRVEDLTIKNMVISTSKLKTLLRIIPRLKKLELIQRNDAEELLHEMFESLENLEVLKLDRCYRSNFQMNMLSQTITSMLESCPKLKTLMLTDTYFHSKNFYRCLAKRFKSIERVNITCTTKSEMDVFVQNLQEVVPEVEFQRVPMMGRAEGKHIYWGPILGLVIRPIPTSPFHRQFFRNNYPNYAF